MSRPLLTRALVGVITLSTLAAPFVAPAYAGRAAACGEQREQWRSIQVPNFATGSKTITAHAVDPLVPRNMYVTNGTVVLRTRDSGCTFKEVFVLPDQPNLESQATAANSKIKTISTSEDTGGLVYLMIEEGLADPRRPHAVVSSDGGGSWRSSDVGLPPSGTPEFLVPAPSDAGIAYLGIDVGTGGVDLLFATGDSGQTWTLRSDVADQKPSAGIVGMTPDPVNADELWAWGTGTPDSQTGQKSGREASGLLHSSDGGRTFQNVPEFAQDIVGPVDVFHAGGKLPRIAAFRPARSDAMWSVDGQSWAAIPTPPSVDAVAHRSAANTAAVTAGGRAYGYVDWANSWVDLGARSGVRGIASDRLQFHLYAHTDDTLEVYSGPPIPPPDPSPGDVFDVSAIRSPQTPARGEESLTPNGRTVRIDPGKSKKVRYRLALSQRPLPLNVFFLLDTSDSMGATIEDLAQSTADIINLLGEEDIALKVGIGAFRAFPDRLPPRPSCGEETPLQQNCEKNYVYRLIYDIQDPSGGMSDALAQLDSDAGGFYKSHLDALYQVATGSGVDVFPVGPGGSDVEPGLEASFHEKALKVVVHATDERFGRPIRRDSTGNDFGNPEPPDMRSFDEVAQAFDRIGDGPKDDIYQIGLSIGHQPRRDLERVARMTGTLAPEGGVDCDGDGYAEIPGGEPLVCTVGRDRLGESRNLVPAIVNTLQAIPNATNVRLAVRGNDKVVDNVRPEVHEQVTLQIANQLIYEVDYRCPLSLSGKKFKFDLAARSSAGRVIADATTTIECGETPEASVPLLAPFAALAALVPPPPPPPPANVSTGSQSQSQAQAQAGAAFQEEKQPQVAVAAAYREMLEQRAAMEYEMVAYEGRREPVSPLFVLGAGFVMAACAYGFALSRERVAVNLQQQRR